MGVTRAIETGLCGAHGLFHVTRGRRCPKCRAAARPKRETKGRIWLRVFREEFEKIHGPQKWKVAI